LDQGNQGEVLFKSLIRLQVAKCFLIGILDSAGKATDFLLCVALEIQDNN
jgi:hypothetical protein